MPTTLTEPLAPSREADLVAERSAARRRVGFGVATALLGLVAMLAFGIGSESGLDAVFVLSRSSDAVQIPDVTVPARATGLVLGVVVAALGALLVTGVVRRRTFLVFGVGLALFVVALLAWAARGDDISIIGLLDGTLFRATPLALGAFAGLLCERAGVVNIAIEGMLLAGAFVAALTASAAGTPWVGLVCGMAAGVLLGAFLGVMAITYRVDQIIGGTVINIFSLGLTSYLGTQVLARYTDLNDPGAFRAFGIPGLERLPLVGPLLFHNTIYVFLVFVLTAALWWGLFRTRWGLRVRSVGEHPRAADTVGIDVLRTRYRSVMLGGAVAGLGGTWFTLDATGGFNENMTAGKGFIALAALIFGRWHPVGALVAALVFAFSEELQTRLALLDTPIPSDFLLMTPYVVTIVVVAGVVGRSRAPAADGQPYVVE
ncbi:MAG: ABC transporter permease [Thermoanaerobacterales bacterium]|jgi:simple sugar transport system permease protein|nr:ABC transporter permease [Thermoanaerobacterales bacterium]